MEVSLSLAYGILSVIQLITDVKGHGMMIEPAMRSSLWRYDYPGAEPNYNDNGLNCGGFMNQHDHQHGRCGICGDPYQGPRDNEAGGKYAKGIIARTYKAGQYITVVSDITANHYGYIELRLCPHNDFRVPVTQQCLDQYPLKIKGHGTRYILSSKKKSNLKIRHTVKLPDFVTCRQCVLQWYWKAGQHSGIDPITNKECIGCGKQEWFVNCADIAITDEFGMFPSTNVAPTRQITTVPPYSMYDTSFMFQGQGMFPEYYDEYNPFFTTPSYFNQYNYNPFMDNGDMYRENMMRNNFGSGLQQNTGRRTNMQPNTGRRMNVQQNTGRRMNVQQNTGRQMGMQQNVGRRMGMQENAGRRRNEQQNRGGMNYIQRNTRPRYAPNNNGDFRHMQQNIRRNNMNNRAIQRNARQNARTNRPKLHQNRQNNNGRNIDGVGGNLGQARISSSPPTFKNSRPLISRNNRPHTNVNNKIEPPMNKVRNEMTALQINHQKSLNPVVVKTRAPILDSSDNDDFMEDMIDDEDMFLTNSDFWSDFNRLLNMSTPDTKHALYEIADDADNLEELHQNIILMLQMQGNSQAQQPSATYDSESDESLDMDWLLAEAKDMELDSDEQNMLGLTKTPVPVKDNDSKEEKDEKHPDDDKEKEKKDPYFNFQDENRIRDDSETDERYSDAFGDSSKEVHPPDYYYDLGPTSDAFEKDYDSSDGDTNNEIKTDNSVYKIGSSRQTTYMQSKQQKRLDDDKRKVQNKKDIWNENSLYKTDILDYDDDKDVDVEENAIGKHRISESSKEQEQKQPEKIVINYLESDTNDYSESETLEEGDNVNEHDTSWEDFTDEDGYKDEEGWSDEKRLEIEANTVIVTAKDNNEDSGDAENEFETKARNNFDSNIEQEDTGSKFKNGKEKLEKNGDPDTDVDNEEDGDEKNEKGNKISDGKQSDKKETEKSNDVDATDDKNLQNTDADETLDNKSMAKEDVPDSMKNNKETNFKDKTDNKLDDMKETATKLDDIEKTVIKLDDIKEPVTKIDDIKEALSKIGDIKETVTKLDDVKEAVTKLSDIKEATSKLGDIKEGVPKIDDIKEAKNKFMTSNGQQFSPVDDPSEPVIQNTLISQSTLGMQRAIGLQQMSSSNANINNFNSFSSGGVPSNNRNFHQTNNIGFGRTQHRAGAMVSKPAPFTNMMSNSPINGNYNNQNKPGISTFRKKIQDKISKSISHKDTTKNANSLSNILKQADIKNDKKELSPGLSKLVLKMFMNTKSTKGLCEKSVKPNCKPVSLWSKYKQIADWCDSLCPYGNCPTAVCKCTCESSLKEPSAKICRAQTAFKEKANELDQWCQKTCSAGDCPDLLCVCT